MFFLHFIEILTSQTFCFLDIRVFLNHSTFTFKWQAYAHTQLKLICSQKKGKDVDMHSLHLQFLHASPETLPVPSIQGSKWAEMGELQLCGTTSAKHKTLGVYRSQEGQRGKQAYALLTSYTDLRQ